MWRRRLEEFKANAGDDPMEYCRLLQGRHDFAGALAVAEKAIKDGHKEAKAMQLEMIGMWYWLGEDGKAGFVSSGAEGMGGGR